MQQVTIEATEIWRLPIATNHLHNLEAPAREMLGAGLSRKVQTIDHGQGEKGKYNAPKLHRDPPRDPPDDPPMISNLNRIAPRRGLVACK